MKRITLILLALCLTAPLFAGDADSAVLSISGDATTTFGVDLMSMATGFTNTLNAKLRLDFKPATTAKKSGSEEGAIYGEILFDEISIYTRQINNVDDNDADLEMDIDLEYAKIMGPNWWFSVKTFDDNIDYENATQNGILGVVAAWDGQLDEVGNNLSGNGGFEAGFSVPDVASVEVSAFSLTDWTAAEDSEDKNAYGVKAEVIVSAISNLTLKAALNMGFGAGESTTLNDDMGFGANLAYAISAGEGITITPDVGVDAKMLDGGGMNLAIGNGLKITLPGSEVTGAEDAIKNDAGTSKAWDDGVNSGLTLGWSYYMPYEADAQLDLQAHVGLSMIENLVVAAGFEATDLLSDANDIGFAVWTKYTAGNIAPYAGLFMLMDDADADEMVAEAGVAITNIVPLTSLYLDWNSGNLSLDEPDLGIVKFAVKVSY
jgi:hypothetical protein